MVPFRKFKKNPLDDEFQEIREQIENAMHYKNIPKVLCADMNFEDIHELMPKTFKQGFKFVLGDNPTTPRNSRYDKIVVSKDWILTHSEIVLGNADHYLCFADIELI